MLRLEGLRVRQGGFALTADMQVPDGAQVALIGPSGAGKSTLLGAIAGFVEPEAGRILWSGRDITALPPGERPLTMLFQDNNLFPHLTARQNAGLGLRPSLRLSAGEWRTVDAALARVGLGGLEARRPAALSGGQQGRVTLARLLLRRRPLALLDEPFAALGPALKADMLALVAELARAEEMTVLLVTHDPADARRFAPLTVVVADGTAAAPQPTAELLADPPPALAAYLGSG